MIFLHWAGYRKKWSAGNRARISTLGFGRLPRHSAFNELQGDPQIAGVGFTGLPQMRNLSGTPSTPHGDTLFTGEIFHSDTVPHRAAHARRTSSTSPKASAGASSSASPQEVPGLAC